MKLYAGVSGSDPCHFLHHWIPFGVTDDLLDLCRSLRAQSWRSASCTNQVVSCWKATHIIDAEPPDDATHIHLPVAVPPPQAVTSGIACQALWCQDELCVNSTSAACKKGQCIGPVRTGAGTACGLLIISLSRPLQCLLSVSSLCLLTFCLLALQPSLPHILWPEMTTKPCWPVHPYWCENLAPSYQERRWWHLPGRTWLMISHTCKVRSACCMKGMHSHMAFYPVSMIRSLMSLIGIWGVLIEVWISFQLWCTSPSSQTHVNGNLKLGAGSSCPRPFRKYLGRSLTVCVPRCHS